ncbi:MAG TPA: hypothetical protein VL588_10155, partial [Bdellovibrionota bacterium]|nr:hypothetical protein [Bdellovibrionota bacterium]
LDASSKDPAYLTLRFAPTGGVHFDESIHRQRGSGEADLEGSSATHETQKRWMAANFRLSISSSDGKPAPVRVNKVEALTVKQTTTTDDVGDGRDFVGEPGPVIFPHLVVSAPSAELAALGKLLAPDPDPNADKEETGTLEYLSEDLSETLLNIDFFNMGIFKTSSDPAQNNDDRDGQAELTLSGADLRLSSQDPISPPSPSDGGGTGDQGGGGKP